MAHYPRGVCGKEFLDNFNKLSGSRLDLARYGCHSVIEMIVDLADIFRSFLSGVDGELINTFSCRNHYRLDNRASTTKN